MESDRLVEVILSAVSLLFLTLATLSGIRRNRWRLQSAARKVFDEMRRCAWWQKHEDPIDHRVAITYCERRVAQARGVFFFAGCIGLVFLAKHLLRLLTNTSMMPLESVVPLYLVAIGVGILSQFPRLIKATTIDLIFSWHILLVVVSVLAGPGDGTGMDDLQVWVYAFACCLFDLRPWLNAVGLVLVAASFTAVSASEAFPAWVMCISLLLLLCWIDRLLKAGVRLEILAADSGHELAAVKTLLGSICDVVVELGSDLCMTQHSAKLADVLLHGSGRSLRGATVHQFMPEEADRRKFVERLSGADGAAAHAEVFHAAISDSSATRIDMEFFSVAFAGPDAQRRHLLGMREFTDILPLTPSPRPPLPRAAEPQERVARQSWPGTPASLEREDIAQQAPAPDPPSETSTSGSQQAAPAQRVQPMRTTAQVAKHLSLMAALLTWRVRLPQDACCPLHGLLADAQTIVGEMMRSKCRAAVGPSEEWQCERCGIVCEENRPKRRIGTWGGCRLCEGVELGLDEGSGTPDVMAL